MQVNIRAKKMAPTPPHLNIAQRMYFMANKEVKETPVKNRKQIAKFFIFRSRVQSGRVFKQGLLQFSTMFFKQIGNIHISIGDGNM